MSYRCADCKAALKPGYVCCACDSFAAEEVPAPGASSPEMVSCELDRIAKLAFDMCSACYSGMDHQFKGMTIVKFARAIEAEFCRVNGLTVGVNPSEGAQP